MIRLTLLGLFVTGLAIYAWRDWYKSLCGLVLLMAVIEHPDMPKKLLGIQGLNLWNLLLFVILLAWFSSRRREGLVWDMPRGVTFWLFLYLGVVIVGFSRMLGDRSYLDETDAYLVSEYLINTVKWVIPGLLLFDGCRSRERFNLGLFSLLAVYFLLAVQVIKWMPMSAAIHGQELTERSLKILLNEVGYHRVNLSMMLGGASWAVFAAGPLTTKWSRRILIVAAGLTVVYAQALTGGRMGYGTWAAIGLVLGFLRYRKYLLLAPLLMAAIFLMVPGAKERLLQGFSPDSVDRPGQQLEQELERTSNYSLTSDDGPHMYTVTAGRNVAWPYVIEKIGESPAFGWGRLAMQRTGLEFTLWDQFRESFPHPHNAYLEMLLDNGWVGFLLVMPFYLLVAKKGISLLRDPRSPVFVVMGGVTCALVSALFIAALGSQTFYPREGSVGMWCAIGLTLRVAVQRARLGPAQEVAAPLWQPASGAMGRLPTTAPLRPVRAPAFQPSRPEQPVVGAIDSTLWRPLRP